MPDSDLNQSPEPKPEPKPEPRKSGRLGPGKSMPWPLTAYLSATPQGKESRARASEPGPRSQELRKQQPRADATAHISPCKLTG